MVTAFVGELLVLDGPVYFALTGLLLVAAAALMIFWRRADTVEAQSVGFFPAALVDGACGFLPGLTGVGGGVFLTLFLIAFGWAAPKRAASLSPPFILCNSVIGLLGVLFAGQRQTSGTSPYAIGALAGAVIGTVIGLYCIGCRSAPRRMFSQSFCCLPVFASWSAESYLGTVRSSACPHFHPFGPDRSARRILGRSIFARLFGFSASRSSRLYRTQVRPVLISPNNSS